MKSEDSKPARETSPRQVGRFWQDSAVEQQLAYHDIISSIAHIRMLSDKDIIDKQTTVNLLVALEQVKQEVLNGQSFLKDEHQDVHQALEQRLSELVGDLSVNLRIAKSANDQIATDVRLWLREAVFDLFGELLSLRSEILALAERDLEVVMPGYTHMQPAMPILLAHWWLAHEARFRGDFARLRDFYQRLNILPLGAGMLAGTSQPIDREMVANYLGFDGVIENSLYAVSDRDFLIEFGSFASLAGMHISQISADLLMWATQEFGFIKLPKAFVFRSLSMPGKRNPVALEVMRSRPSMIFGRLIEFIATLKSLPSGYCHDLHECMPSLLELVDNLNFLLELTRAVLPAIEFNAERMKNMAAADLTNASAAMEFLIDGGMPADKARKTVEQLVNYCKQRNKGLADLALSEWQQFSPAFDQEIYKHVTVEESVGSLTSFGGTAHEQVVAALDKARQSVRQDQSHLPAMASERLKVRELQNI